MFLCLALLLLFTVNAGLAADLVPGPTVGLEDDVLLGHPTDVDFGPDGRAYVLDSQLNTVHVLAPDGRYERSIGKAEGMNSKIQMIERRACGFRNRERFKTAIYFHLGGLDLYPRGI